VRIPVAAVRPTCWPRKWPGSVQSAVRPDSARIGSPPRSAPSACRRCPMPRSGWIAPPKEHSLRSQGWSAFLTWSNRVRPDSPPCFRLIAPAIPALPVGMRFANQSAASRSERPPRLPPWMQARSCIPDSAPDSPWRSRKALCPSLRSSMPVIRYCKHSSPESSPVWPMPVQAGCNPRPSIPDTAEPPARNYSSYRQRSAPLAR